MKRRNIPIAYPTVLKTQRKAVQKTLETRWIGQGPQVDAFEAEIGAYLDIPKQQVVTVNSGTSALELAYHLLNLKPGDEVIVPVLTCTATNLPLIRRGVKIVFADIKKDSLTIDPFDVRKKITSKTRAIVVVDLHGIQADRGPYYYSTSDNYDMPIPVVVDAAQAFGNTGGQFTCYSFQAIKQITTADGGALICEREDDAKRARLLRWFGVDREKKMANGWQPYKDRAILFDIVEAGYKYHMNDVAAAMGRAALAAYPKTMSKRVSIWNIYVAAGLPLVDGLKNQLGYACLLLENRDAVAKTLAERGIETNVMHVRNDAYTVFAPFRTELPQMDWVDSRYLCIPLHTKMSLREARYIAREVNKAIHAHA